ncbi:MAG: ABC transporter substrate binding protein [Pseudomonadota bacterium]
MEGDGNIRLSLWILIQVACLITLAAPLAVLGADDDASGVAAIVSNRIRPYADALGGVRDVLDKNGGIPLKEYWLNDYPDEERSSLGEALAGKPSMTILTIGPEALVFAQTLKGVETRPIVYTVVLSPERLISTSGIICGVSLNIPVSSQLSDITKVLPDIRRLGLLFDPAHNREFLEAAGKSAMNLGVSIVPLPVTSKTQIPEILEKNLSGLDGVWMIPDKTVISERIVQYIIRETITQKKPVIGYNRFFYESGAVASFEFDYRELGIQAGECLLSWFGTGECPSPEPRYKRLINTKVAEKINIRISGSVSGGEVR